MRSVFVDTNLLVSLQDQAFPEKAAQTRTWMSALAERNEIVLSPQVVSEFIAVSARRFRTTPLAEIHRRARALVAWCHAPLDAGVVTRAMEVQTRFRTSWWDALVVTSAIAHGCRAILSEDLQDGMRFGPATVVNPFRHQPETLLA